MSNFITSVYVNNIFHLNDLEIPLSAVKRQHLLLTGKNGSGKTSLLNAIMEFIEQIYGDKCYICERIVTTDYEVEHLASRKNHKSGLNEWENLFIACNYCNDKKKNSFDGIKHPDSYNVEEVIIHSVDLMNEKVNFSTASTEPGVI